MEARMTSEIANQRYLILSDDDYTVLGPQNFGAPGLRAVEAVGPFVEIEAHGPLITVHDSTIEPRLGIGHHPHRYNERMFYIMTGSLDHDDARNDIQGQMATGDVGLFTEGRRGMLHSEWNNGDEPMRAYMIVYTTDPIPEDTDFRVFKDADAPRYDESPGVRTKEMLGPKSSLRINGDLRLFTDSRVDAGATFGVRLGEDEGAVVAVIDGAAAFEGEDVRAGNTLLFPPRAEERGHAFLASEASRFLRIVHGPGFGLRRHTPRPS
jgi:redox-sensitive bicupin YhaK (pirin superfamily)